MKYSNNHIANERTKTTTPPDNIAQTSQLMYSKEKKIIQVPKQKRVNAETKMKLLSLKLKTNYKNLCTRI